MIFYEDRTECDCGELLYQNGINYLIVCGNGIYKCPNCGEMHTDKEVE